MRAGEIVGGRFALERRAGEGGMGVVWCARDLAAGGAPAAVKLLHAGASAGLERFVLEAEILSSLAHPGIVRYLGHRLGASGPRWLAMEWLEGEDLAQRLASDTRGAAARH